MKILQINWAYNYGSTGKITYDIHMGLSSYGHESVVCYGRGARTHDQGVIKICPELLSKINNVRSRITGIMYGGFIYSTNKLIQIIQKEKPDVVHLQCINCFFVNIYRLVSWLNKNRIKTILTLHAEFMYTANCGHALDCEKWRSGCGECPRLKKETRSIFRDGTHSSFVRMQRAFHGFEENLTVVSVSPWLRDRAMQSPILKDMRHMVVYNGLDTEVFHPQADAQLIQKHRFEGKKIIFHATPSFSDDPNHLKGGWAVLELAERMKDLPVVFVIAGKYRLNGVAPENVIFLGQVSDQHLLAKYYSMADATILTSKRETFSMVCAESLCCGTPVFGFLAGAPELIALKEYSRFVANGNVDALQDVLTTYLMGNSLDRQTIAQQAIQVYSKETMLKNYVALYEQLYS